MAVVATVAIDAHWPVVTTIILVVIGRVWIMDAHVRWWRCDKRKRSQKWVVMGRVRLRVERDWNAAEQMQTRSIQLELCRSDYTCR